MSKRERVTRKSSDRDAPDTPRLGIELAAALAQLYAQTFAREAFHKPRSSYLLYHERRPAEGGPSWP